ncbi:tRNA lysidine(34) synthetase TilS [Lysobacter sp. SG-8]|uniref:tRNA(Ile)-lysidine synthase n=1 Tax=Marilutibacter penaei TaxID=2759900 RepID=A0A7W3U5M3_9GAMM|nr:tRNA lysidine(34) synthetase TilS [Lysobacter penaei]MBB1089396.1 tRNA lysidine(34) synthetase TilS [Lysobacter penaei]
MVADLILPARPAALPGHAPLRVALSGGLDSTVLLHRLANDPAQRRQGLSAVHVDHGLHPHAGAWAAHCQTLCDRLGIVLRHLRVEVPRDSGLGLEGAARKARHAAFEHTLVEGEVMVLAHHRDDQAETFLLRALRASGPEGLAGMPAWRRCGRGWLWRPLLQHPRDVLRAYAEAHRLEWIEDPSNEDPCMDRNFLRHRVLPLLAERWPHAGAALATSATLAGDAAHLLRHGDIEALEQVQRSDPSRLDVAALLALPAARRARVLRHWVHALGLPALPAQGIRRVERDLLDARADAVASFRWAGARIRRWRDCLHAGRETPPLPATLDLPWDGTHPLALPGGGVLRLEGAPRLPEALRVRARQGGERIRLPGRSHEHALKHVLQGLEVPPWVRERLPLLLDAGGRVIAAADFAYDAGFDAWLRERGARLHWQDGEAGG